MLIKASDIKKDMQLAESDGFLWEVTEIIKETQKTITVRLNSDFSNFKSHWKGSEGIIKSFSKDSFIEGVL